MPAKSSVDNLVLWAIAEHFAIVGAPRYLPVLRRSMDVLAEGCELQA